MKNNFMFWLIVSMVMMLFLPFLTNSFVNGDAGMAVCIILFYAVNPIYSLIMGVFAGTNIKKLWPMPIVSAVLFLFGSWIFFGTGEGAFILYAVIYLILGAGAMVISVILSRNLQK